MKKQIKNEKEALKQNEEKKRKLGEKDKEVENVKSS